MLVQEVGLERKGTPEAGERKSDRSKLPLLNQKFNHCPETVTRAKEHRCDVTRDDLVSLFLETASKAGAKTIRLAGLEQVEELLRGLLTERERLLLRAHRQGTGGENTGGEKNAGL